jgi:hypothetical protein
MTTWARLRDETMDDQKPTGVWSRALPMNPNTSAMRALLCTNHLIMWSGSELVVLDLAEALLARGWQVEVFTNVVTHALARAFEGAGIPVCVEPKGLRAFDFDLVWVQHHTAPLLDYQLGPQSRQATRFVFAHLSPYTEFEMPGLVIEPLLADLVLCNSRETEAVAIGDDLEDLPRRLFPNPAPSSFCTIRRDRRVAAPRRVAAISNHLPPEVGRALSLLRDRIGAECVFVGSEGDLYGRVTPTVLAPFDLIVTIGKSVQYALAAGIPVYCYDRFGGPGYLRDENFDRAAHFNFSGRCTRSPRSAEVLVQDILENYAQGLSRAARAPDPEFLLEPQLDAILSLPVRDNASKVERLVANAHRVMRESKMAVLIRRHYRGTPTQWPRRA